MAVSSKVWFINEINGLNYSHLKHCEWLFEDGEKLKEIKLWKKNSKLIFEKKNKVYTST